MVICGWLKQEADECFLLFCSNHVLQITDGIHDLGNIRWPLLGCLLLAWFIVFACLFKGVQSSGKVSNYTKESIVVCGSFHPPRRLNLSRQAQSVESAGPRLPTLKQSMKLISVRLDVCLLGRPETHAQWLHVNFLQYRAELLLQMYTYELLTFCHYLSTGIKMRMLHSLWICLFGYNVIFSLFRWCMWQLPCLMSCCSCCWSAVWHYQELVLVYTTTSGLTSPD